MELLILVGILALLDVAAIYKGVDTTNPLEWEKRRQWQALRGGVL